MSWYCFRRILVFSIWFLTNISKISFEKFIMTLFSRWVSVVEFHDWAFGIGKVFCQESTVIKWNYQTLGLHQVTVCQKLPILDFQSEFSMSKINRIFIKKNFIEEYQFRCTFFVKSIFCWLQFSNHFITKMTPNFWQTVTWWRPKIWYFHLTSVDSWPKTLPMPIVES